MNLRPIRSLSHLLLGSIACLLFTAPPCSALQFLKEEVFTLESGHALEQETWLYCDTDATVDGTAENELFLLANRTAQLSGLMQDDIWVAASQIVFDGNVQQHLRGLASSISGNGSVSNNLFLAGNSIMLDTNTVVAGESCLIGETVVAKGIYHKKVTVYAASITLEGQFDTDVYLAGSDIVIMPGTIISGNISYLSQTDLILDPKVIVGGTVGRALPSESDEAENKYSWLAPALTQLYYMLAAMIFGALFVSIFSQTAMRSWQFLRTDFLRTGMMGFGMFFLIPILAIFLLSTVICIPISLSVIAGYFFLAYAGKIVFSIYIGRFICHPLRRSLRKCSSRNLLFINMSTGLFVLYVMAFSGGMTQQIIWMVSTTSGLGALIRTLLYSYRIAWTQHKRLVQETKAVHDKNEHTNA
ncbi:MAG: hypothetical protein EOL87_16040 [Spartobacteria bacterium]|nr:hypothetical protein [Spartobacteria bacterium]